MMTRGRRLADQPPAEGADQVPHGPPGRFFPAGGAMRAAFGPQKFANFIKYLRFTPCRL